MTKLTDKQVDKLYEMTEIHFRWFQKKSPKVKYEEVLKLNHIKMLDIIETCSNCSEEMVNKIFDSIIDDYLILLKDDI
jgi:primase-polymerase (primpol)-like protein